MLETGPLDMKEENVLRNKREQEGHNHSVYEGKKVGTV